MVKHRNVSEIYRFISVTDRSHASKIGPFFCGTLKRDFLFTETSVHSSATL